MKTNKITFLSLVMTLLWLSSCQDFDKLEKNPNQPSSAPPSLLFNGVLNDMYNIDQGPWSDVMKWNQFYISNYNYYGNNQYNWSTSALQYTTLKNVVRMEQEATKTGLPAVNPYSALGKFFRAYFFTWMTQRVGDIPTTEALKGLDDLKPKYDDQKAVYSQVLQLLEDANSDFTTLIANNDKSLSGDIYLNNDLTKWQKVVNAYKLRVLISLSKKEGDTDLNIKQKFAEVVNTPSKYPLMTGLDGNLQYAYNFQFNRYPLDPSNLASYNFRNNIASTFLNLTTSLKDPRTFIAATPAPAQLTAGLKIDDFAAYVGGNSGDDMATLGSDAQQKFKYSYINAIHYSNTAVLPEPQILIGYPEMCFNIAEAISRGWASGNAGEYYTNGIKASLQNFGIGDGTAITIGDLDGKVLGSVTVSATNYLAQESVVYKGNNADGLNQILVQKYLAFFQNSGLEAFYNQRRTGVPTFSVGLGTGNSNKIPVRWQYPTNERTTNSENYASAVQNQFSGSDDINQPLWILK